MEHLSRRRALHRTDIIFYALYGTFRFVGAISIVYLTVSVTIDLRGDDALPAALCLSALILWCLHRILQYLGQEEKITEDYYYHPPL